MSPNDRDAQLYLQAMSSHFAALYDLQAYNGCILLCLHADG
jgi:hypothetical protein